MRHLFKQQIQQLIMYKTIAAPDKIFSPVHTVTRPVCILQIIKIYQHEQTSSHILINMT